MPDVLSRDYEVAQPGGRPWTVSVARIPPELWVAVVALGFVISVSVVPGVFTTDDNNYLINVLALRQGRVTVAVPEGVSPSRELLFFEPAPWSRSVESTPVASTAPPLYAPLALPFALMGWRGLVSLNTIAFLLTIVLVFLYAGRYSKHSSSPWVAAAAFALGGFLIEYAQGVWPHALSVLLCTAGIFAAGRLIEGGRISLAAAAGVLLGLASGIRYQNIVVLGVVGAAITVCSVRRWKAPAAFMMAAAVPLLVSSAINHARLGSWNPVSKGKGYYSVPLVQESRRSVLEPAVMFWARVVDYSVRPRLTSRGFEGWLTYEPATGAHLIGGTIIKKAFLQSVPWAVLGFLFLVLAWSPWFATENAVRLQARLLSLVAFSVPAAFALSGAGRDDGLSFNQRYLLELLPLAAVSMAWALDSVGVRLRPVLLGAVTGASIVVIILLTTPAVGGPATPLWLMRQLAIMKAPLLLAGTLAVVWSVVRVSSRSTLQPVLTGLVGACLGWGLMLHAAEDLPASREIRRFKFVRAEALRATLPDRSAFVAHWGHKDAAVPLLFERDIVILDLRADDGEDAPRLIRELLGSGRRVFLLDEGISDSIRERVVDGLDVTDVQSDRMRLRELRRPPV